jgi:DNA-binding MurR/RpiR family transcriptional regulator
MTTQADTALSTDPELGAPQEVQARIRTNLGGLRGPNARVARAFVEQPNAVIYKSASEVGEMAGTSSATVVRCAQKIGFKGFHDLKLALAKELSVFEEAPPARNSDGDPRLDVLTQITLAGAESVRDAGALVDPEVFDTVVGAIANADRVLFLGFGTSAPLCQDAAYRFSAIGVHAQAPGDVHVQHVAARLLSEKDVAVMVSHTGSTRESLTVAKAAVDAGARSVAITSFVTSPLTELVDHVILAGTRELTLRLEAMASRLAHLALLDALLVAVAGRDPQRSEAALELYTDVLGEHRL